MTKTFYKECRVRKKSLSFPPPWEFQTPLSLGTSRLLINLPRNWLSQKYNPSQKDLINPGIKFWRFKQNFLLRDHHGSGKYYCSPGPEITGSSTKKGSWSDVGKGCIVLQYPPYSYFHRSPTKVEESSREQFFGCFHVGTWAHIHKCM